MPKEDLKVSFLLDGGIDDRSQPELRSPVVQQGGSPKLARSVNTRLSRVRGTPVRAPGVSAVASTGVVGVECHGVIVSETGEAALEFFLPGDEGAGLGNRAVYGEGSFSTAILRQTFNPTRLKTGYVPTAVEPFVALAPAEGLSKPMAVAYDETNGYLWFLVYSNITAFGYVVDTSGRLVAPLQYLFDEPSLSWAGLTWHGANGFYAWYEDGTGIRKRNLTLSGSLISVGAETAVYAPAALGDAADVCRIDDNFVAILGTSSSSADDATLRKHNVATGAETTVTLTNAALGTGTKYSVACTTIPSLGSARIAAAWSEATTPATRVSLYDTDLVPIWGPITPSSIYGQPAVRFQDNADGAYVVIGYSDLSGSFSGGTNTIQTSFSSYTVAGGVLGSSVALYWSVLGNRGAQLTIDGRLYPMFFLQRAYSGPTPPALSSDDYVDDPSVDCVLVTTAPSTIQTAVVARIGCVRGSTSPARCLPNLLPSAAGAVGVGPTALCTYLVDRAGLNTETAFGPRAATVSIVPKSLRVAHDKSGTALAAAGVPVQWDGVEVVELGGPLYRPHLKITSTGGSGVVFPAGAYSFLCVYEWYDGASMQHRTRISNVVTLNAVGTEQPILSATSPLGLTLLEAVRVRWFGTAANGITYHDISGPSSATAGVIAHSNPAIPETDSPQVFSTGEAGQELMPQPAPPLHDVAIIGSRAYGIDAEIRSRGVYSKLRAPGIGYEWHPGLEINFPSGGGDLQRVFELNGVPVFVATRGTFYVTGEGPDNTGAGGFFSSPTKVSEHGCSNPLAFCAFPGGAVWKDLDRWVVMRGMSTQYVPEVASDFDPSGTILLRRSSECVFVNRDGGAKVYNYEKDAWSTWDSAAIPATSITANVPYSDYISYLYSPDVGSLHKMNDATISSATSMELDTDWVILTGDFQDEIVLRPLVFRAYRAGNHSLRIRIYTDFSASPTTDKSWSNAELADMADGQGAYTIRCEPDRQASRAVRILISDDTTGETASAGMRPVALTVYYAPKNNIRMEAFVTAAGQK